MDHGILIDKTLDVTGLSNLRLGLVAEETLFNLLKGSILRVVTSGKGARTEISALCERLGCSLLSVEEAGGVIYFTIRK